MPRRKFNKETSTTYALVYRAQNDPLIHDENAPSQVFKEVAGPSNRSKIKHRIDLEEEFGISVIRPNEGEAAEHGIYYDDSSYDYMQHMRELGDTSEAAWIEAPSQRGESKNKQNLEDALRNINLEDGDIAGEAGRSLVTSSILGGSTSGKMKARDTTYQSQQDIPDALAGFQPDMDPRLREVLEALDDDAYVAEDDDVFAELAGDGAEEVDLEEWENNRFNDQFEDDDEDSWESDDTTRPTEEFAVPNTISSNPANIILNDTSNRLPTFVSDPKSTYDGDWLASFTKSKPLASRSAAVTAPSDLASVPDSSTSTANSIARKKKRKGALTSTSNYSMTSSSLARTEPLSTLDERFDRIAELYMEEGLDDDETYDGDDGVSLATDATGASIRSNLAGLSRGRYGEGSKPMPAGFDAVLDEFLGGSKRVAGKKGRRVRGRQTGMEQLDEVRSGLGPVRVDAPKG